MKRISLLCCVTAAALFTVSASGVAFTTPKRKGSAFTVDVVLTHKEVNALQRAEHLPITLPKPLDKFLSALQQSFQEGAKTIIDKDNGRGVVVSIKAYFVLGIPPKSRVKLLSVRPF